MTTLRIGSKGDDVRKLQRLLKINVDGIFGPVTAEAVREFQKIKGLEVDGVVGPKTWAALGVENDEIIYAPLKYCITRSPNRKITYLAIHYTAGGSSAPGRALSMKNSWEKSRRASADYGVDDRDMVQFNPDPKNYYCWAVGDKKAPHVNCPDGRNNNTISIEICSSLKPGFTASKPNHSGWYYTDKALANGIKLARILMQRYNIPIENVVRHYDISGKLCPGIIGYNDGPIYTDIGNKTSQKNNSDEWKKFKQKLT